MTGEMLLRYDHQSPHCMGTRTTMRPTTTVVLRRDVAVECVMVLALFLMRQKNTAFGAFCQGNWEVWSPLIHPSIRA